MVSFHKDQNKEETLTFSLSFVNRVNWEEKVALTIAASNSTDITMGIPDAHQEERQRRIIIYTVAIFLALILTMSRSLSFFKMCLRASITLHDKLFRGIIRAKMLFFNNNPSGRILNRFSTDIGFIDAQLPVAMMDCLVVSENATLLSFSSLLTIMPCSHCSEM